MVAHLLLLPQLFRFNSNHERESAGIIASIAIDKNKSIYDLSYDEIKIKLEADGQILQY